MEFFILMISVPLFLIIVLLLAVFVLAKYPSHEQAKGVPAEESPTINRGATTTEGEEHFVA
jgi:hypothetical protein